VRACVRVFTNRAVI